MNFVKDHFDKMLMSFLFLVALSVAVHMFHHMPDSASITWIENVIGQILAALLTLMVGQRMAQRGSDTNGANGKKES